LGPLPASENGTPHARSDALLIPDCVDLQQKVDAEAGSKDSGRADSLHPREDENIISPPSASHSIVTPPTQPVSELPSNNLPRSPPISPPNPDVATTPPLGDAPSQGCLETEYRHQADHDPAMLDRNVTNTDPNKRLSRSDARKRAASAIPATPVLDAAEPSDTPSQRPRRTTFSNGDNDRAPFPAAPPQSQPQLHSPPRPSPPPDAPVTVQVKGSALETIYAPPRGVLRDVIFGGYYLYTPPQPYGALPSSQPNPLPQNNAAQQSNAPPQPPSVTVNWPHHFPYSYRSDILQWIQQSASGESFKDIYWGDKTFRFFRDPGNLRWEVIHRGPFYKG